MDSIVQRKFIKISFYFNLHRLQFVPKHSVSYLESGEENDEIVVCCHALTRNATDFCYLMKDFKKDYRVISLDIVGRGYSDSFSNKNLYNYITYMNEVIRIFKKLGIKKVNWIGSSMGGILGILLAAKYPKYFKTLIVNDIGPEMPKESLTKIDKYLGKELIFDSLDEVENHLRKIFKDFGISDDEHWEHMAKNSSFKNKDNKYRLAFDSAIKVNVKQSKPLFRKISNLWNMWKKIECPTMLLHGKKSDILTHEIAKKMAETKPSLTYKSYDYCGHMPSLYSKDQIDDVKNWIDSLK